MDMSEKRVSVLEDKSPNLSNYLKEREKSIKEKKKA